MKIDSSTVSMASDRQYANYLHAESATLVTTADKAALLDFSDESKSLAEQMKENKSNLQKQNKEQEKNSMEDMLARERERSSKVGTGGPRGKSTDEIKLEVLKRMLEALRQMSRGNSSVSSEIEMLQSEYDRFQLRQTDGAEIGGMGDAGTVSGTPALGGTQWKKTTVTSVFYAEMENTAYSAQGTVKTADGREIKFGVDIEMSRAFCQRYESFTQEEYICTDPLVINLDHNVGSVSDQKFLFDLDSDGKEEAISFAGKGSGFLALDKNSDGKINDGNELFGTKTGNGFRDLAEYDKDQNGWIDEADDIFKDLKIWTKEEQGKDRLMNLKEAGIGAIYLDHASTQFSLKQEEANKTNGVIRNSGIYLKESGEVGTIQHIDLTL